MNVINIDKLKLVKIISLKVLIFPNNCIKVQQFVRYVQYRTQPFDVVLLVNKYII